MYQYILKISKKFISNEELIKKLEEILLELPSNKANYVKGGTNSLYYFIKGAATENFLGKVAENTGKLVSYCEGDVCTFPKKVLQKSGDALSATASASSTWIYVANGVGVVGHGLAAYLKFQEKY